MDSEYWNTLFEKRTETFPPEEYLVKKLHLLRGKTILDLGCGDGRNSLYLTEKGYDVTAVDFSDSGLAKIKASNREVKTVLMDINDSHELGKMGLYDNILLNHFIPDETSLRILPDLLSDRGVLIIVAFDKEIKKQRENVKNLILEQSDIDLLQSSLEIIENHQIEDERGIFNRCIFRKK